MGILLNQTHSFRHGLRLEHRNSVFDNLVYLIEIPGLLFLPGEGEKAVHNLPDAVTYLFHAGKIMPQFFVILMSYEEFLTKRRTLMAQIIKCGFETLA